VSHYFRQSSWKVCPQFGSTRTFSPVEKSVRQIEQHLYLKELRPFAAGVTDNVDEIDERRLEADTLLFSKFSVSPASASLIAYVDGTGVAASF